MVGIVGLCSIILLYSCLECSRKVTPSCALSLIGKLSSTLIFLENLENTILEVLCASCSSLTLKNCAKVVINPDSKFKEPIAITAYSRCLSGILCCAKLAVPVKVLKIITGIA